MSEDKSRVYFSPNVAVDKRSELCEILGFRATPTLGKYLRFPFKHDATPQDFGFIIDRVQSHLSGWKANLLSFVDRLVLTLVVTTTFPNYVMQCVALSPKILNSADTVSRNFLWVSSERKKKITKPKREGSLGI